MFLLSSGQLLDDRLYIYGVPLFFTQITTIIMTLWLLCLGKHFDLRTNWGYVANVGTELHHKPMNLLNLNAIDIIVASKILPMPSADDA